MGVSIDENLLSWKDAIDYFGCKHQGCKHSLLRRLLRRRVRAIGDQGRILRGIRDPQPYTKGICSFVAHKSLQRVIRYQKRILRGIRI